MSSSSALGIALVERDVAGDDMVTWKYPSLDEDVERVALSEAKDAADDSQGLFVSKLDHRWIYSLRTARGLPSESMPQISAFSLVLTAKEFAPEKFEALLRLIAEVYKAEGAPTRVLELYLKTFTLGKVSTGSGSWNESAFDARAPLLAGGSLKDLVAALGVEAVLLWHAMLIKRRILVVCADRQRAFAALRALPRLVWHRQDWSLLRPSIRATKEWEADLKAAAVYCAGTADSTLRGRSDLFDIVVDLDTSTIHVSEPAKADCALGAAHREVAKFMTAAAADPNTSEHDLIKGLATRTRTLLNKLRTLAAAADSKRVARSALTDAGYSGSVHRFLFNVAAAEDIAET